MNIQHIISFVVTLIYAKRYLSMKHYMYKVFLILLFYNGSSFAQWVQTDGPYAANIRSVAIGKTGLFVSCNSGIFRSTNNGSDWKLVNNGLPSAQVYALAIIDTFIFAGTDGQGVYRSSDNGESWSRANTMLKNKYIWGLSVSDSILYALSQFGGIFRSIDFGETWNETDTGLTNTRVYTILSKGTRLFAASATGIYSSTDKGINWSEMLLNGMKFGVTSITFSDSFMYASTYHGIYRSSDEGIQWKQINNGLLDTTVNSIIVAPDSTLLAATKNSGLFRSIDNGMQWSPMDVIESHKVTALVKSATNLFVGTNRSLYFSREKGQQWVDITHGLTFAQTSALITRDSTVFAGTDGGIFRSTQNYGWDPVLQVDDNINTLSISKNIFFAGGDFGNTYYSTDTGKTWIVNSSSFTGKNIRAIAVNGANLFVGIDNNGVWRSIDNGVNWTGLIKGLTDNINAFALVDTILFLGTDTYGVFRSTDNGTNWEQINNGLTNTHVYSFAANDSNIWVGTGGGIFFSSDTGSTWIPVKSGLTDTAIVALAINRSDLFAGIYGYGVFKTSNKNRNWVPVNNGLTNRYVGALSVNNSNLFAATSSSGIWHLPLSLLSTVEQNEYRNKVLTIYPNYPNPFSSQTTIVFSTSKKQFMDVKIIDLLGKECTHLYSGELEAGDHYYELDGSHLTTGIYFCFIRTVDGIERQMIVRQ